MAVFNGWTGGGAKINGIKITARCTGRVEKGDLCAVELPREDVSDGFVTPLINNSNWLGAQRELIVKDAFRVELPAGTKYLILYRDIALTPYKWIVALLEMTEQGSLEVNSRTVFHQNNTVPLIIETRLSRTTGNSFVLSSVYDDFYYAFIDVNEDGTITATAMNSLKVTNSEQAFKGFHYIGSNKYLFLCHKFWLDAIILLREGNTLSVSGSITSLTSSDHNFPVGEIFRVSDGKVAFCCYYVNNTNSGYSSQTPFVCLVSVNDDNSITFDKRPVVLQDDPQTTHITTDISFIKLYGINENEFGYIAAQGSRNAPTQPYYYYPYFFTGVVSIGPDGTITATVPPAKSKDYVRLFEQESVTYPDSSHMATCQTERNALFLTCGNTSTRQLFLYCALDNKRKFRLETVTVKKTVNWGGIPMYFS